MAEKGWFHVCGFLINWSFFRSAFCLQGQPLDKRATDHFRSRGKVRCGPSVPIYCIYDVSGETQCKSFGIFFWWSHFILPL